MRLGNAYLEFTSPWKQAHHLISEIQGLLGDQWRPSEELNVEDPTMRSGKGEKNTTTTKKRLLLLSRFSRVRLCVTP